MRMGCASTLALGLILVLLLFAMAGCVQENEEPDGPVLVEYAVSLYFINNEYAETGDMDLEPYVIESREVYVNSEDNPWLAILEELKSVESEGMGTVIGQDVIFDSVTVSEEEETMLILDLGSIGGSGGSLQEGFFIGQIVQTLVDNSHLFESGQKIDKVQFLVEGETVESLMGHISAEEPFTNEFQ